MRTHTRRFRPGFTFVELLVVIAIMMILLAILMPSLQRVREHARLVQCSSNLRQINVALTQYAHDREGVMPPAMYQWDYSRETRDNQRNYTWFSLLVGTGYLTAPMQTTAEAGPELESFGSSVLICPNTSGTSIYPPQVGDRFVAHNGYAWRFVDHNNYGPKFPRPMVLDSSYIPNTCLTDHTQWNIAGALLITRVWANGNFADRTARSTRRISQIKRPSETPMFLDGTGEYPCWSRRIASRHGFNRESTNMVMFDGSVVLIRTDDFDAPAIAQTSAEWNHLDRTPRYNLPVFRLIDQW